VHKEISIASLKRFQKLVFAEDNLQAAVIKLQAQQVIFPRGIETDGPRRWVRFYEPAENLVEFVVCSITTNQILLTIEEAATTTTNQIQLP
jgi:hypothetical protein